MFDDFHQLSNMVMEHISKLGRGRETQRVYALCIDLLGTYLSKAQIPYSPEAADKWLLSVQDQIYRSNVPLFKAAINKFNDLYSYGEIQKGHYDQSKTIQGKLCAEFQIIHQEFLVWDSAHASETIHRHSWGCAKILLHFQENGVFYVTDISYELLSIEFSSSAGKTRDVKTVHHTNLRLLLQFLYEQGLVPYGFTLFVDGMSLRNGCYWNCVSVDDLSQLQETAHNEDAIILKEFLQISDSIYQEHIKEKYSESALKQYRTITNLFYLFLDINHICYTPQAGRIWLESLVPNVSRYEYMRIRRILCLIEQQYYGNRVRLESFFSFKETSFSRLPEWCKPEVEQFLTMKEKEGLSHSTVSMYRCCICRFCAFLDSRGVGSFKDLTPIDIKLFNQLDRHSTPTGKNAYNSRIRKFLQFLGEAQKIGNPFLFLSLSCASTTGESLVITLTEDEQSRLTEIFQSDDSPVALREKAILQLGLYMGLRGTDIVSLTIDEIDWENATIRVIQDKTKYEIVLPMPTSVANALYRYIMYERPESDKRSIFLRKVAPFSPVSTGACENALKKALPGRDISGSGFHVTRKTFATNLLRNETTPQQVAEALGHQGMDNVNKYLSLDERHMRLCGFSLAERNLSMKGGF